MLNGLAPILIFHFPIFSEGAQASAITGIPVVDNFITSNIGIPVPIYLDEQLTGLQVKGESKVLDIETEPKQRYDGKAPEVKQRGVNNTVTVNLTGKRDSTYLAVLLALSDQVFSRVVAKKYSVTYVNGPTTVFNGLLQGFSAVPGEDNDLIDISIQISKANLQDTLGSPARQFTPKGAPAPVAAALTGGL